MTGNVIPYAASFKLAAAGATLADLRPKSIFLFPIMLNMRLILF